MTWSLVTVTDRATADPKFIPLSSIDRASLKIGDLALLLFSQGTIQELMWAVVTRLPASNGVYVANLDSGPNRIKGIAQGYPLTFTVEHVMQIYRVGRDSFAS